MSQQASAAGINANLTLYTQRSSLRPRAPASDSHSHLTTPLEPRDWDLDAIPAPSLGSPLLAFSAVGTDALPYSYLCKVSM